MKINLKNLIKNYYYKFNSKNLVKNFPDWSNILRGIKFKSKITNNPQRILIATSTGGHRHAISAETLFGLSLKARGVEVDFLYVIKPYLHAVKLHIWITKKDFVNYGSSIKCSSCWNAGNIHLLKQILIF